MNRAASYLAVLLVAVLSLPASAVAAVVFYCASDDAVHDACCCGPADGDPAHACCCTPQLQDEPPDSAAIPSAITLPVGSVVLGGASQGPEFRREASPPSPPSWARGPPPSPPPKQLFVLHAAFLI